MKKYFKQYAVNIGLALALLVGVSFGMIDAVTASALGMALTTSGQLGNGTILRVSLGSPTAYVQVANPRNIEFDTGTSARVDMTNLNSEWKEFLLGLPDPGSLTFEVDTNFGDAGQAALRSARVNRTRCNFQVVLPAGTTPTATMEGFVAKFPVNIGVDTPVKTSVEVYLTGPITLA
jgi:hypothetical protein